VRQQPAQEMNTRHYCGQRGFMLWYSSEASSRYIM